MEIMDDRYGTALDINLNGNIVARSKTPDEGTLFFSVKFTVNDGSLSLVQGYPIACP